MGNDHSKRRHSSPTSDVPVERASLSDGIVTVSEAKETEKEGSTRILERINRIDTFHTILAGSEDPSWKSNKSIFVILDNKYILRICSEYQEYHRSVSSRLTSSQRQIIVNCLNLQTHVNECHSILGNKALEARNMEKHLTECMDNVQKLIQQSQISLQACLTKMITLTQYLPEEEQFDMMSGIEPFKQTM